MAIIPALLNNIDPNLLDAEPSVIVNHVTGIIKGTSIQLDTKQTPGEAKDINSFYDLAAEAIRHSEKAGQSSEENKVYFGKDFSFKSEKREVITYELIKRRPGDFSQGDPFGGSVKNLKPVLREEIDDEDNPGYKKLVFGYFYDNLVRFTCYGRTHKEVDDRAIWLEKVMNNYLWFFRYSGLNRVLYMGRGSEIEKEYDGFTIHGRQVDYFVKTEEITIVSEKEIEQLVIEVNVTQ